MHGTLTADTRTHLVWSCNPHPTLRSPPSCFRLAPLCTVTRAVPCCSSVCSNDHISLPAKMVPWNTGCHNHRNACTRRLRADIISLQHSFLRDVGAHNPNRNIAVCYPRHTKSVPAGPVESTRGPTRRTDDPAMPSMVPEYTSISGTCTFAAPCLPSPTCIHAQPRGRNAARCQVYMYM